MSNWYRTTLSQAADPDAPQKLVLPLPPAAAPAPQAAPQQQQPQSHQSDQQIIAFINQNRNNLPTIVKNALSNSTQRAIIVALIDSLGDPENHDFLMRFVNFTKSQANKNEFRNNTPM